MMNFNPALSANQSDGSSPGRTSTGKPKSSNMSPGASRFGTAAKRRRMLEPTGHVPGETRFETGPGLKNLLKEHSQLKIHQTKNWLKRKVQFDKFNEPEHGAEGAAAGSNSNVPQIKKKYLMSEQEMKQDVIIETIFNKFDSDGSGALDLGELVDLFKQNKVTLDKETVK